MSIIILFQQMRFSSVYFVLLLLFMLVESATFATFFTREQKLSEFNHKLDQKLASSPTSSQTKMVSNYYATYVHCIINYFHTNFKQYNSIYFFMCFYLNVQYY
jgi:hypothetical protein